MLFVTNRTPIETSRSSIDRSISFDLQNTTVSQNLFFCERHDKHDYLEIGSNQFFTRLKSLEKDTQVVLYLHGFNNTDEKDIFPRAEELENHLNQQMTKQKVVVIPLIWPCDDDSALAFLDDYWDDQQAADHSGTAFARLLGKFDKWRCNEEQQVTPCLRRINLVAHSMGNRVLQNTLNAWVEMTGGEIPQIFRNIFMPAADISNSALEKDEKGQHIPAAARNVVVYYANDDLAMPASKVANTRHRTLSKRMGMTGPRRLEDTPRNVYEVDCDNFNNQFDMPKGHSYFIECKGQASPVLIHMANAIESARVFPNTRHHEL